MIKKKLLSKGPNVDVIELTIKNNYPKDLDDKNIIKMVHIKLAMAMLCTHFKHPNIINLSNKYHMFT